MEQTFPPVPTAYTAIKTIGAFTIARKRDGMFYIFDRDGGVNTEACFTTLERAEAYVPTIDHMTKFTATVAGSNYRPSWSRRR